MPVVQLSTSNRKRRDGLPYMRAVNVLWQDGVGAFFDRPALIEHFEAGPGPVRGMYAQSGLFGGDKFYYSGSQLYRETSIVFTAPGESRVRFAGGSNGGVDCLVFCADGLVYRYETAAGVVPVAITDDTPIYDVLFFGSRFLFFAADGRFYFSAINDPTTIEALSFETAEAKPDGFLRAVVSVNQMYIFGPETVEVFYLSSDEAAPYAPDTAGRLDIGAYSADLVYEHEGRVWFVSSKKQVFAVGGGLRPIADDSVLEALGGAGLETCSLYSIFVDGIEILILTDKAVGSFVYDGANWYRWNRTKKTSMNIAATLNVGSVSYAGDMSSGRIYRFDNRGHKDSDYHIERIVSAYRKFAGGRERNINAMLLCGRGAGTLAVPDPQVEMRFSDDFNTWSEWDMQPLGPHGVYNHRPCWRALGLLEPPGRVYEFRCTDDVSFEPQAVIVDEGRL